MAKRHDENKCLRSFKRIGRVDMYDKTLQAPKNAVIGIHLWGKIDYLTKYCGWHFIWNNNANPVYTQNSDDSNNNDVVKKKQKKEHKLTDKTKKNTKKEMSKLGLSLKISVPKSKTIPKPSVKIEAKNKRGYVILEDKEYKVSLINESDGIHNRTTLPFTKKSYDLKGKTSIFSKTKGKYGYTRYVRTEDKAKVFPGDSDKYVPFAPNWIVKGDIINDKGILKFDFVELLTIKGYTNMIQEDE